MSYHKENQKKQITVYLVWAYLEWGGAQIYFLSIVKQAREYIKFILVVPEKTDRDILKLFEPYNVEFEFIDTVQNVSKVDGFSAKLDRRYNQIKAEFKIYSHLSKKNLTNSIIHIESAPWQSWLLLSKLAKLTNVIVTIHNALPENSNWREKVWSARLNSLLSIENFQIFAANQNVIDKFREKIKPEFWNKLKLTRACINPEQIKKVSSASFDREQILKKNNLPTDKFIVLCVGQFIDRKGRWVFLESAKEIKNNHQDVIFVWLMPNLPDENDELRIKGYGLDNYFFPIKSSDAGLERFDVLSFFRIADIFVLPSFVEGLPITLLETMSIGICSVSTNIMGIPEAIKNGETGVLIESGSSRQLTEAILLLKNDDELREKLKKNGQKFVLENFDEKHWANVALEEYEKCFNG